MIDEIFEVFDRPSIKTQFLNTGFDIFRLGQNAFQVQSKSCIFVGDSVT